MASNHYPDSKLLSGYPDNTDICFSPSACVHECMHACLYVCPCVHVVCAFASMRACTLCVRKSVNTRLTDWSLRLDT